MKHLRRHVLALSAALLSTTLSALAQTSIVLDGTSGNNTVSTNYNSSGGLQISLGFFADYLLVGGGGSGGTPGGAIGQNHWGTGGGGGGKSRPECMPVPRPMDDSTPSPTHHTT